MNLWIFDQDFNKMGLVSTYRSLVWEEAYQNRGVFTLVVNDTQENINLLLIDRIIYMTDKKTAMVIKYRKFISENQTIEIRGFTTLDFIDQRGLLGTTLINNAEQGMRQTLSNNLRGFPSITQSETKGYTETIGAQYSNTLLLPMFSEISVQAELGIRMLFDHENKRHVFDVYKGIDRTFEQSTNPPVMFSEQWGNLAGTIIVDDRSLFKNVAYVFGAGEGEDREMVEVGTAQGKDRYELFVDARDLQHTAGQTITQYRDILYARGITTLNGYIQRASFQAEVDSLDFGVKYDLGDRITCKSQRYGIQLNTRILQFKQQIENNISKTYLTLGQPEITALGELKLWLS